MLIAREATSSWFSIRLAMMTFLINITAIGYLLFSGNENASLLGLLLAYAMNLNENILLVLFNFADLEIHMISLERVLNFTKIEPEKGYKKYMKKWRLKEEGFDHQALKKGEI